MDIAAVLKNLEDKHAKLDLTKDFKDKLQLSKPKEDAADKPFLLTERRPRGMQPRQPQNEEPVFISSS